VPSLLKWLLPLLRRQLPVVEVKPETKPEPQVKVEPKVESKPAAPASPGCGSPGQGSCTCCQACTGCGTQPASILSPEEVARVKRKKNARLLSVPASKS
jgi:hypothetical protein